MTKTEAKEEAQHLLFSQMTSANLLLEKTRLSEEDQELIWEQMQAQAKRVSKLFGYDNSPIVWG